MTNWISRKRSFQCNRDPSPEPAGFCEGAAERASRDRHAAAWRFPYGQCVMQQGEPLLIDMDRLATGHPILELSDLYYFYVLLGADDPGVVERFMGFSYDTAQAFFRFFLKHYLGTEDEDRLNEVSEKASLIGYSRLIRKIRKQRKPSEADNRLVRHCVERIAELTERLDSLCF